MNRRKRLNSMEFGRLLDTNELCSYLNMGENRAVSFANECGARRKFGKSLRYDRAVIDARLNAMHDAEPAPEGGSDHAEN